MSDNIYSNEILPNNYNIIRRDCDTRGGGVATSGSKKFYPFKQLSVLDKTEIIIVEITIQKQIHILCLVYRPPRIDDIHNRKIVDYIQSFSYTSHLANCILLAHLIATLMHYPCTIALLG